MDFDGRKQHKFEKFQHRALICAIQSGIGIDLATERTVHGRYHWGGNVMVGNGIALGVVDMDGL